MRVRIRDLPPSGQQQRLAESASSLGLDEQEYHFTGPIDVLFTLEQSGDKILCHAQVSASVEMACSRCVEPVEMAIREELTLIFATADKKAIGEGEEDLKIVLPGTDEVDVSEEIRQTVLLAIPTKPLCSENCRGLCPQCGINLNIGRCRCQRKVVDPRWSGLKKLLSNGIKGE